MSNLGDAPHEVLSLVLSNVDRQGDLYQCALVNKNFYAMTNPLLWREPQLVARCTKREDTILNRLKQSFQLSHNQCLHSTPLGHNVCKLNASNINRLQDLLVVINNVPLVEELVIGIETFEDHDMEQIALNCPLLNCLSCTSNLDGYDRLFDRLRHCTNLRELSIRHCINLCERGHLHCTSLCKRRIRHRANLHKPIRHRRTSHLQQHCPQEKVRLDSHGFKSKYTKDLFFGVIPTLTHLDMDYKTGGFLRYCQLLPPLSLFPVLTDLRIANCQFPDNDAVVSFFQAHPLIRTLSLEKMQIDLAVMTSLATDLIHLQRLSLINNGPIPPFTKTFHRLEKLTLRGGSMSTLHMAMYFPNLRYIHISIRNSTSLHTLSISSYFKVLINTPTNLTYLPLINHDSVPGDLKVHLPRRMGGQLDQEDLDHIRDTALGLVWIGQ
ncbi:hypothetical protein [Absidia glauca]|uniref:F-box domain-containing protein n=1 Tax=Absidia glauca TaxID=4829 RepID=A0A163JFS4_ABSGL|nr:hypothetical protein [Absidia glauca]